MFVLFVLLEAWVSIFVIDFQLSFELVGVAFVDLAIERCTYLWRSHVSHRGVRLHELALIQPACRIHAASSDVPDLNTIVEELFDHAAQIFVGLMIGHEQL